MTVEELISQLKRIPDKSQTVLLPADQEGNKFDGVSEVESLMREYGYVISPEDADDAMTAEMVVVLWP